MYFRVAEWQQQLMKYVIAIHGKVHSLDRDFKEMRQQRAETELQQQQSDWGRSSEDEAALQDLIEGEQLDNLSSKPEAFRERVREQEYCDLAFRRNVLCREM